jgi:hypothetical protein
MKRGAKVGRCLACCLTLSSILCPSVRGDSETLASLLERTGRRIELFWEQFSAVACTESITQKKVAPDRKILSERRETFDYLIMMQLDGDELSIEESRFQIGKIEKKARQPLLVTNGFAVLLLILHPHFQGSYEFTRLSDEGTKSGRLLRTAFQPIQGRRSPSALSLRGKDYPIPWKGCAWLDSQSGMVTRIQTELGESMEDLGLRELKADVSYAMVKFVSVAEACWLPQVALVDAETLHQRWRNIHQFQNYRKFSVETKSKTEEPEPR